jgi:hypothetical protein
MDVPEEKRFHNMLCSMLDLNFIFFIGCEEEVNIDKGYDRQ